MVLGKCSRVGLLQNISLEKLLNVLKVAGFCDTAVMVAVRKLFPHDLGRLAQLKELLHV